VRTILTKQIGKSLLNLMHISTPGILFTKEMENSILCYFVGLQVTSRPFTTTQMLIASLKIWKEH
jgi:hypothetical protein